MIKGERQGWWNDFSERVYGMLSSFKNMPTSSSKHLTVQMMHLKHVGEKNALLSKTR